MLDLGCGDGLLTGELAQTGAAPEGVDLSAVALERARSAHPDIRFEQLEPGRGLPFEDASFAAVVCVHVLQHVADTQTLMSEARRVLRPGGTLCVVVPHHGRPQNVATALRGFERHHDPLEPVVRFYTRRSLTDLLDALGFESIQVRSGGGRPLARRLLCATALRP